nr:hypothetical protein [uncultured Mucilaginibacter sp.]
MKTTFNHERGFLPQLSGIIYIMICLGVLLLFMVPLIILLVYNLSSGPGKIAQPIPLAKVGSERMPYLKLTNPLQ